ncbi:DUF4194 domain-containing protein [Bradyrhizobium sp. UFLA01-814]|uniref:hypothetical protein n=1 Tax=Bradyrhizobium sp. UFLA01-814 TaxID=3023480 RepID=UPI00398B8C42
MKLIQDRLKAKNVRLEEFQAVNALLISRGFLSREDGVRHRALYMVAQRCQDEIQDVLAFVYGASLFHDPGTSHFRLQPFGARDIGLPEVGEEMEIRRELKGPVHKDFTAALLTLKLLYDELIIERRMGPGGRVAVRVTEFVTAMKVNFKVDLPTADFHRKAIFMKLKKHGVAEFNIDELKDEDAVISIRPEIGSLVYDSAVAAAVASIRDSNRNSNDKTDSSADTVDLEVDSAG